MAEKLSVMHRDENFLDRAGSTCTTRAAKVHEYFDGYFDRSQSKV